MITVITSVALVEEFDAPQVFNFDRVLEVRDFLASAPRTGWKDIGGELISAGVLFAVVENHRNITDQVIAEGWIQSCEAWR